MGKSSINKSNKEKIFSIRKVLNQKKWTKEEDKQLIELVQTHNEKKWKEISNFFHNKNPLQCFSRYKRIKPGVNKGSWNKEEDDEILKLIKIHGTNWSLISKIIKTRNNKQIRDRYINILAPNLNKKKFTFEEDMLIIKLYKEFGAKWSRIHTYFKNRTTDMIKNRFHSSIKKKYKDLLKDINKNKSNSSTDSSSSNNKEVSTIYKLSYPPSNYINNKLDGKKNNSSSNISQNSQNSNYNYVNNSNNNNGSINNNNNNNNIKFWNLDLLDYNMEQDEYFKQFNFQN
jgi:hypothetical protein